MAEELKFKKTTWQKIKDFIFFPLRVFFNHETVKKLGLTSFQEERFNVCLPYVRGRVLDIGCGQGNKFIKMIGGGVGLDPHSWPGVDVVAPAEKLPFEDKTFDVVTLMVTISYVKDRDRALGEIRRVLKDDGCLLISESPPVFDMIRRALIWWNPYQRMPKSMDLTGKNMLKLIEKNDLKLVKIVRYIYGLSRLYVISK
ncbi:MAG: methyltransferase domain-containing protein [bacterium]